MPFLQIKLFDTCAINNLYGLPGLLGSVIDPNFEGVFGRGSLYSIGIAIIGGAAVQTQAVVSTMTSGET